jgi:ribosomal protein L3
MRAFSAGTRPVRQQLSTNRSMRASSSRRAVVSVQARQAEAGVGVFATKAGMMTYFTADGLAMPATVLAMESPNYITGLKTQATDGYDAVQVGYKEVVERKVRKPELGHLKKAGCPPLKHLREFKVRAPPPARPPLHMRATGRKPPRADPVQCAAPFGALDAAVCSWCMHAAMNQRRGSETRSRSRVCSSRILTPSPLSRHCLPSPRPQTQQLLDAAKVAAFTPGQKLDVAEMFKEGDSVDIAGTTIGKGFQGERGAT